MVNTKEWSNCVILSKKTFRYPQVGWVCSSWEWIDFTNSKVRQTQMMNKGLALVFHSIHDILKFHLNRCSLMSQLISFGFKGLDKIKTYSLGYAILTVATALYILGAIFITIWLTLNHTLLKLSYWCWCYQNTCQVETPLSLWKNIVFSFKCIHLIVPNLF